MAGAVLVVVVMVDAVGMRLMPGTCQTLSSGGTYFCPACASCMHLVTLWS